MVDGADVSTARTGNGNTTMTDLIDRIREIIERHRVEISPPRLAILVSAERRSDPIIHVMWPKRSSHDWDCGRNSNERQGRDPICERMV